ncbi:serine hydroxymethyltransferase domain protein [Mycobacterium xenopi 3993]|nr:serine hydroxymethyltransferase domain protein [Mycobacterium xenopi 3993]
MTDVLTNTTPQGSSKAKYTLADGTAQRVRAAAAELLAANPLYPGWRYRAAAGQDVAPIRRLRMSDWPA